MIIQCDSQSENTEFNQKKMSLCIRCDGKYSSTSVNIDNWSRYWVLNVFNWEEYRISSGMKALEEIDWISDWYCSTFCLWMDFLPLISSGMNCRCHAYIHQWLSSPCCTWTSLFPCLFMVIVRFVCCLMINFWSKNWKIDIVISRTFFLVVKENRIDNNTDYHQNSPIRSFSPT